MSGRSLETNKETALAFLSALPTGVIPDTLLTEDFAAWTTSSGDMAGERYRGGAKLLASALPQPMKIAIEAVTGEGEQVVIEAQSEARLDGDDSYRNRYAFIFRFRDGRIARVREHFDPRVVAEKLMPLLIAAQKQAASHD